MIARARTTACTDAGPRAFARTCRVFPAASRRPHAPAVRRAFAPTGERICRTLARSAAELLDDVRQRVDVVFQERSPVLELVQLLIEGRIGPLRFRQRLAFGPLLVLLRNHFLFLLDGV